MLRLLVLFSLLIPVSASAAEDANLAVLKAALAKRIPDVSTDTLRRSDNMPGWYELEHNTQLLYVSPDGKRALAGDVIDLETKTNLTQEWRERNALQLIDAVGEKNMIVIGPANAKRSITVFTDVDCPYCVKLHRDVPELNKNGVKVRYLLFPRGGPGSETYHRSVAVWCSKDRADAVGIAKMGGKLDMKTCPNPVDSHLELGHRLRVNGTPTIYLDDGKMLGGYVPSAKLLAMMNGRAALKTSDAR